MQCEEDAHCSGLREVRPCAADCVSTWTAMCHLNEPQNATGNFSFDEYQLISHCMTTKIPFQTNGDNDYLCVRTSQVQL